MFEIQLEEEGGVFSSPGSRIYSDAVSTRRAVGTSGGRRGCKRGRDEEEAKAVKSADAGLQVEVSPVGDT